MSSIPTPMAGMMPPAYSSDVSLPTLYLRIDYADSPFATLGVDATSTEAEVRDAYHNIALSIHPDKAPTTLQELHTSLFQKIQAAYQDILTKHFRQSDDTVQLVPERLPETEASLHARNIAFREALRTERERALQTKKSADATRSEKEAKIVAKNDRLASKREALARAQEEQKKQHETDINKNGRIADKKCNRTNKYDDSNRDIFEDIHSFASDHIDLEWEQEEERLREEGAAQKALREAQAKAHEAATLMKQQGPIPKPAPTHNTKLQNKPTTSIARPTYDSALDTRLVSDPEIKSRCDKQLLSGGRNGTVSLAHKKQTSRNAATKMHKRTMALAGDADGMLKPALTGNRTFGGMAEDKVIAEAFVGAEKRAEKVTEKALKMMDFEDACKVLESGGLERLMNGLPASKEV